ncbi:MAG: hypothetical protein V4794_16940 [Pseudomonadota bacterium]
MSSSFSLTEAKTFTIVHARDLAAKVATDLKRIQRLYGHITDQRIAEFESEATELLRHGYLKQVTYGFKRNCLWIEPTLRYTANDFTFGFTNDDPGRIAPGKDIANANFSSFLEYTSAWFALSESQRTTFESGLALQRVSAEPSPVNGSFVDDKTYSAGERTLGRSSLKGY